MGNALLVGRRVGDGGGKAGREGGGEVRHSTWTIGCICLGVSACMRLDAVTGFWLLFAQWYFRMGICAFCRIGEGVFFEERGSRLHCIALSGVVARVLQGCKAVLLLNLVNCFDCFVGLGIVTIPHGVILMLFAYALVLEA